MTAPTLLPAEAHSQLVWTRIERSALTRETAGRCVVCGGKLEPDDGDECLTCIASYEAFMKRVLDRD